MVKYYYPAIYGDTPIDDEYGHEGRLYVSEGDYAALEARIAELEKDAARWRLARRLIASDTMEVLWPPEDDEEYSKVVDAAADHLLDREA